MADRLDEETATPHANPPSRAERRRERGGCLLGIAIAAALLLAPHVAWRLTTPRPLAVTIVDKTVAHVGWREHAALQWWFDHRRRTAPAGGSFALERDYVGFDPVRHEGRLLGDSDLANRRLAYVADAYGVYAGDFGGAARAPGGGRDRTGLERSPIIFGGMDDREVAALERFHRAGGAVVAEFNTLESPTWGTPAGERMARLVGARYAGWLARWYEDLESAEEIPTWMRDRWRRTRREEWPWDGPGLVFFAETEDRIVVVPEADFTSSWPVTVEARAPRDPLVAGVRSGTPYWYWMSGVEPLAGSRVLAEFVLHVNDAARARLDSAGFPVRFPAVVRRDGDGPLAAYLAGDFADVGAGLPPFRRTRFLDPLQQLYARTRPPGDPRPAFWGVATPIWDAILRDVDRTRTAAP